VFGASVLLIKFTDTSAETSEAVTKTAPKELLISLYIFPPYLPQTEVSFPSIAFLISLNAFFYNCLNFPSGIRRPFRRRLSRKESGQAQIKGKNKGHNAQ
jgi:hypothetical protein